MVNNEKKYPNTNLINNEKKTPQYQGKNQTYPNSTEYTKKKKEIRLVMKKNPNIKGKTKE